MDHIYLAHHGIKGMKWGVRRYQNPDGSLTTEGMKRYRQLVTPDGYYTEEAVKTGFEQHVERGIQRYALGKSVNDPFVRQVIADNKPYIDSLIAQERARQANMLAQEQARQAGLMAQQEAERAARMNASLAISGGTNPFLFGA